MQPDTPCNVSSQPTATQAAFLDSLLATAPTTSFCRCSRFPLLLLLHLPIDTQNTHAAGDISEPSSLRCVCQWICVCVVWSAVVLWCGVHAEPARETEASTACMHAAVIIACTPLASTAATIYTHLRNCCCYRYRHLRFCLVTLAHDAPPHHHHHHPQSLPPYLPLPPLTHTLLPTVPSHFRLAATRCLTPSLPQWCSRAS